MPHTSQQMLFPEMSGQASPARPRKTPDLGLQNKAETFRETEPRHSGDRLRVVQVLQRFRCGLTRHQIAEQLGVSLATVCGRVNELKRMGEVRESGERRPTENGRMATVVVWIPIVSRSEEAISEPCRPDSE